MPNSQKGFSTILFLVIIFLTIIVVGAVICWTQIRNNQSVTTKPGLYLQQIQDPEKFAEQNPTDTLGKTCGGFAGITCSTSLTCKLDGDYPDASGKCIRE